MAPSGGDPLTCPMTSQRSGIGCSSTVLVARATGTAERGARESPDGRSNGSVRTSLRICSPHRALGTRRRRRRDGGALPARRCRRPGESGTARRRRSGRPPRGVGPAPVRAPQLDPQPAQAGPGVAIREEPANGEAVGRAHRSDADRRRRAAIRAATAQPPRAKVHIASPRGCPRPRRPYRASKTPLTGGHARWRTVWGHWRRVSAGRSAGLCGAPRMRGGRRGRRAGRGLFAAGQGWCARRPHLERAGGTREAPTPHFRRGRRVLLERRPRRKARRPVRGQPRRHRSTRLRHPSLRARFSCSPALSRSGESWV